MSNSQNTPLATDPIITLCLPVSKVNLIISGLAELPFKMTAETIEIIRTQANAEIQRQQSFMAGMQQNSEPAPNVTADPTLAK